MVEKLRNEPGYSMNYSRSIHEIIRQRYSCRTYLADPLDGNTRQLLTDAATSTKMGPLGTQCRFNLIAASGGDPQALKSLGTYGFIKGATGYIVGAVIEGANNLEDFGYLLESIVLYATDLGLGTCWLGGTFTKSSFAKKISAQANELVPGVISVGYIAKKPRRIESLLKGKKHTDRRLPWGELFFENNFQQSLPLENSNDFNSMLKMVRLAPSASNRQPWRVVKDENCWHFYLRRTPGYRESPLVRWTTVADLQRIDMGIAMSHFELSARELGLDGRWRVHDPKIDLPDEHTEYTVSWVKI
jgi:nitroreductase